MTEFVIGTSTIGLPVHSLATLFKSVATDVVFTTAYCGQLSLTIGASGARSNRLTGSARSACDFMRSSSFLNRVPHQGKASANLDYREHIRTAHRRTRRIRQCIFTNQLCIRISHNCIFRAVYISMRIHLSPTPTEEGTVTTTVEKKNHRLVRSAFAEFTPHSHTVPMLN